MPILLIGARRLFQEGVTKALFVLAPLSYVFLFLLDYRFSFLPNFPDSHFYRLALTSDISNAGLSSTYVDFHYLTTPLRVLDGGVPSYIVINSIMFVVGATLIWKAWARFSKQQTVPASNMTFLILLTIWPGGFLYNSSLLREGPTLLLFAVLIYAFVLLYTDPTWVSGYLLLLFSLYGLVLLRKELIPASMVFVAILIYWQRARYLKTTIPYTIAVSVTGYLFLRLFGFLYLFSPSTLSRLRNNRAARYNAPYMGEVTWSSWIDIFPDLVPLTVKFLISPLTINPNPLEWFIATVDAIFIIVTILLLFIWILKYRVLNNSTTVAWLLGLVVLSIGFGLIEVNATGAPRHRMPVVLILLPVVTTAIVELANERVDINW